MYGNKNCRFIETGDGVSKKHQHCSSSKLVWSLCYHKETERLKKRFYFMSKDQARVDWKWQWQVYWVLTPSNHLLTFNSTSIYDSLCAKPYHIIPYHIILVERVFEKNITMGPYHDIDVENYYLWQKLCEWYLTGELYSHPMCRIII